MSRSSCLRPDRTRSSAWLRSPLSATTAVCDPLCGSTPVITALASSFIQGVEEPWPTCLIADRCLRVHAPFEPGREERGLIDRAAEASGTDVTSFVIEHLTDAARQVLADRDRFSLDVKAAAEWERINRRTAKELAGLKRLMRRPAPFTE
jgi:uncharacterized protein (DUF1778 family)